MAAVRIIDEWLRAPAAAVIRQRAIVVVANRWSEQRVLMRAFTSSRDRLAPTIVWQDRELMISPAGLDPNGPWGIHVADRECAGDLSRQLTDAARNVSESPAATRGAGTSIRQRAEASVGAEAARAAAGVAVPGPTPWWRRTDESRRPGENAPSPQHTIRGFAAASEPLPAKARRRHGSIRPPRPSTVAKTMPLGLRLEHDERRVLEVLSRGRTLAVAEIAAISGISDVHEVMARLARKFQSHGLDVVEAAGDGFRLRG